MGLINDCHERTMALVLTDRRNGKAGASADECFRLSAELLDAICAMPEVDRRRELDSMTIAEARALHGIALSEAVRAARRKDPVPLRYGLLALLFEGLRDDPRYSTIKLCMLAVSAKKIGADIREEFANIQHFGDPTTGAFIDGFLRQGVFDLGAYGYVEVHDQAGFVTYRQSWR